MMEQNSGSKSAYVQGLEDISAWLAEQPAFEAVEQSPSPPVSTQVVAEQAAPAGDVGLALFTEPPGELPVPILPPRMPVGRRGNQQARPERRGGRALAASVMVIAVAGAAAIIENASNNDSVSTDSPTMGVSHHDHKSHQNAPRVIHPSHDTTPTTAPTSRSSASPSLQPYLLTGPSTVPSPESTQSSGPTLTPGNSGAGSTFLMGTYNQPNRLQLYKFRRAMNIIDQRNVAMVGMDEDGPRKYAFFAHEAPKHGYKIFPNTNYQGYDQLCSRNNAILYDATRFRIVGHKFIPYPQYPEHAVAHCGPGESAIAGHANAPEVIFQDKKTGQEFIEINFHNIANVKEARGHNPGLRRAKTAVIMTREIRSLNRKYPDLPKFVTCDCNEHVYPQTDRNNTLHDSVKVLLAHRLKVSGLLDNVACLDTACSNRGLTGIDFIYDSPGVRNLRYWQIRSGGVNSGPPSWSDHGFDYGKVKIEPNFSSIG